MKSGPEFESLAFQKLSDQTSGLDHHKTQIKIYILVPDSGLFSFLLSPSLSASRVWMRILPALMFLFAELNHDTVSCQQVSKVLSTGASETLACRRFSLFY